MTQTPEIVATLEKAKGQMMDSIQAAGQAGQWDRAQWMVQKAKDLDEMIVGLRQNGHTPLRPAPAPVPPAKPKPAKLPHFYIHGNNKLAKIAASRDGGTYEHRIMREHY